MTITYPAVFRQKEDGSYDGYFPDLPFVSHHEDIATGDHEFVQDISVIIHLGVGYY